MVGWVGRWGNGMLMMWMTMDDGTAAWFWERLLHGAGMGEGIECGSLWARACHLLKGVRLKAL